MVMFMYFVEDLTIEEKLEILSDAAKYDAACTSSGVDRKGKPGQLGNTSACGICHSFSGDGRCISLLKVLYTNDCIYDCKYCINRSSNDTLRTSFTPRELCELTIQFYRRNYIEGLFLSSGIRKSADATMEELYLTIRMLRQEYRFNGYIHVKGIPGASPELIDAVGSVADRMSLNLELPTAQGLRDLAPGKTREKILPAMRRIQMGIHRQQERLLESRQGREKLLQGGTQNMQDILLPEKAGNKHMISPMEKSVERENTNLSKKEENMQDILHAALPQKADRNYLEVPGKSLFVPAGQSTQMIVGATKEHDYELLTIAESLYKGFELKRVFYSAYVALNEDALLPAPGTKPPLLREHRLYQADWLLRYYGFEASELLSPQRPDFNVFLDPKCDWAVRHLEIFPVEVNTASYALLLRVPGVGVKSAKRILQARRSARLDFPDLKRIGVVLKRAHYFITCQGRMMHKTKIDEDYITRNLISADHKKNWELAHDMTYRQLSLFDTMSGIQ